tara:strand:+ start:147 stop:1538 length:1392 start_codon:yes stop_codon:yes gene_type:complete
MIKERIKRFIIDLTTASLSWLSFFYYRKVEIENSEFILSSTLLHGTIGVTFFWAALYIMSGNYIEVRRVSRLNELFKTITQSIIGCLIIFFCLIIDDIENYTTYTLYYQALIALIGIHFFITFLARYFATNSMVKKIQNKQVTFRTILIGDTESIITTYQSIENMIKSTGNELIGYIHYNNETIPDTNLKNLGKVNQLETIIKQQHIEEAIISFKKHQLETHIQIVNMLIYNNIITKIPSDISDLLVGRVKMKSFFDLPFIEIKQIKMLFIESFFKRIMDVLISLIALIILSPLLSIIALVVKLTSRGPILYYQERLGIHAKPFSIIKFRSMKINAEKNTPLLASKNDTRITSWGKIMRKYRLDELPQFYNVLIGEMSIIGPRPERLFFANQIIKKAPHYKLIYKVKPGITSWGMVKFGYAENIEEMIERLKYDIIYLENLSLISDFKVFILTIFIIIQGRGK